MSKFHERIPFRLFKMPCCGQLVCWVNPRSPNFCPECGSNVFVQIKSSVMFSDDDAILSVNEMHSGMEIVNVKN